MFLKSIIFGKIITYLIFSIVISNVCTERFAEVCLEGSLTLDGEHDQRATQGCTQSDSTGYLYNSRMRYQYQIHKMRLDSNSMYIYVYVYLVDSIQ
jgi:hypothetical protein